MSELEIQFENGKAEFLPGGTIRGCAKWQLESDVNYLQLSLYWRTDGRAEKYFEICESMKFEFPGPSGQRDFEIEVPSGPYSFKGRLFSIIWTVELSTPDGKLLAEKNIAVSSDGKPVTVKEISANLD